jgi:hypothetical protein
MLQDALVKLDQAESENLLQEINPKLQGGQFAPATVTILGQELSFYPGYRFLDMADYESAPPVRRFVIYKPGDVVVLNWTNEPIYELNARAPIHLTEETAVDYVRFFFTYIRGRHGRFQISENVDDILWREEPPPAARKAIGNILAPVSVTGTGPDGAFLLSLCMMFKDSLFKAACEVKPDGLVTLSDEQLMIEDMPVLDDMFGQ